MNYFTINTKSITQAEKARRFLLRSGIKSAVERATGASGCGFRLKIYGERNYCCKLLAKAGINCDLPR